MTQAMLPEDPYFAFLLGLALGGIGLIISFYLGYKLGEYRGCRDNLERIKKAKVEFKKYLKPHMDNGGK